MRKVTFSSNSPEVANSLHNLGNCYLRSKELNKAIQYLQDCYRLRKSSSTTSIRALGSICNSLGLFYKEKQIKRKAITWFQKALQIYSKVPNDSLVIEKLDLLLNYSNTYFVNKEYDQCLQLQKNALAIIRHSSIKSPLIKANIFSVTSNTHDALGQLDSSVFYQQLATEAVQKIRNQSTIGANIYNNLGNHFLSINDFEQAALYFEEARKRYQLLPNSSDIDYGNCLNNLAVCFINQGYLKKAVEMLDESLSYLLTDSNEVKLSVAIAYLKFGKSICSFNQILNQVIPLSFMLQNILKKLNSPEFLIQSTTF